MTFRNLASKRAESAELLWDSAISASSAVVGVEIGQVLALTAVLIALSYWRTRPAFARHAFVTNALLMTGGFLLVGVQLSGYFLSA